MQPIMIKMHIPLWGDAQQIAEYNYTRKAWEEAQDAARMTAYRESAETYLKNVSSDTPGLRRPPSVIGKDAELDARVNAHRLALNALAEHEAALQNAVSTAIKRGILKLLPAEVAAPLLAQFDDDELRDVELLDTLASFAETWVRAADPNISVTRVRSEIEHYLKPSPAQYQLLRRIEDQARGWALAKSAARLTCDQCDVECGYIVDQEAVHGIRARLGTWTDDKYPDNTSKYHDVVEITYTIRATVEMPPLTMENSPAQFPLRVDVSHAWVLNFIIA